VLLVGEIIVLDETSDLGFRRLDPPLDQVSYGEAICGTVDLGFRYSGQEGANLSLLKG
jgi:hypothetical protein